MSDLKVVEICAGAGGQALGLEQAGFSHTLAIELDSYAARTLRANLGDETVREGDVADRALWNPADHENIDLFAGGVPCPPFSMAGHQLGAVDERDLFAWAVETTESLNPKALLLENVRGLSMPRFAAYRQYVLDRLKDIGYVADWRLLHASDYGVPQLRPRFVLVALRAEYAPYFSWPIQAPTDQTVGTALYDLMSERGWKHVDDWVKLANSIAPTIVGGSKRHGGADLGPTRAKAAWRSLSVDGMGIANEPPAAKSPHPFKSPPRLTIDMVARLQGWERDDADHQKWLSNLDGGKTAQYRQIGNAFPPPVARSIGRQIAKALDKQGIPSEVNRQEQRIHDPIYRALAEARQPLTAEKIMKAAAILLDAPTFERRLANLSADFKIDVKSTSRGPAYSLGKFKAFLGEEDHRRNDYFVTSRNLVS